jgi:hypothetical protein
VVADLGGQDRGNVLRIQPDGRLLVGGTGGTEATEATEATEFTLARLRPGRP